MFNSKEYEWADITTVLAGRMITGLRGIKYSSEQEKESLYGKGNKPQGIQRGNKKYSGEITVTQSEYLAMQKAAGGDILDISFDITVAYGNPSKGDAITTDNLIRCEFTKDDTDWKQGDKFQEKKLPFIYCDKKPV